MQMRFDPPELVPVLSQGKHRNPRRGACFMEFASFLSGEKWSDHPQCTHPLVATVARTVNDCTSDRSRSRLAPMIPSVIGLTSDDPRVMVLVALRCACSALPVAAATRQNALATGVLACERAMAVLDGVPDAAFAERIRVALARVPNAERWARNFMAAMSAGGPPPKFTMQTATSIVGASVQGIAQACVPDRDERLYDLLAAVIVDCTDWTTRTSAVAPAPASAPPPVSTANDSHPARGYPRASIGRPEGHRSADLHR